MGRGSRSRSRSPAGGKDVDEKQIQKLVNERQECRKNRDFGKADDLRKELSDLGVQVDDTDGNWRGPRGLSGKVDGLESGGGVVRRDNDWDCSKCGKMNFARRDSCFTCGTSRLADKAYERYRDKDRSRRRRRDSSSRSRRRRSRRRRRRDSYSSYSESSSSSTRDRRRRR
eukprot:TRINITY_DN59664_c0_g1_i1.p1 TRINITY_DN59664_c0_g1~~TRINITY_DN59664_c0_g1_i1.p1  ORF type:complete len:171 (+),score=17.69 TRINITY_DN59664_c0_g1_i1:76-588(+)